MTQRTFKIILPAVFTCAFFALAASADAATYYIKPGGSGTASCLDGTTNACNFARAHALAANGDTLIWKGGTYNLSDSWPKMVITKTITMKAAPGETPVISAATYPIVGANAPSDNNWGQLLQISANNVVIDGLTIQDTGYRAGRNDLNIQSNYGIYSYNRSGTIIRNCTFRNMWHHAIALERGSGHLIENNRSEDSVNCFPDGACGGSWGATFHIVGTINSVIRGNSIIRSYGEGIHTINGASDTIIENNIIYDCYMNPIRIHSVKNQTVRNNLIYSTQLLSYTGQWGSGIGIGMERYRFTGTDGTIVYCDNYNSGHRIYGNRIAGYRFGINISTAGEGGWNSEHDAGLTARNCKMSNVKIFNNTVAMTYNSFQTPASLRISDNGKNRILSSVQFKNNLFWTNAPGDSVNTDPYPNPATFDYNLWNKIPPVNYMATRGTHDPGYPSYPSLSLSDYLAKSSGWNTITPGSLSAADFDLKATAANAIDKAGWLTTISSASGSGKSLSVADQYFSPGDIVRVQGRTANSRIVSVSGNSLIMEDDLSWTQGNGIALAFSGSAPDIGADEYIAGGGDTQAPAVPSGLAVR